MILWLKLWYQCHNKYGPLDLNEKFSSLILNKYITNYLSNGLLSFFFFQFKLKVTFIILMCDLQNLCVIRHLLLIYKFHVTFTRFYFVYNFEDQFTTPTLILHMFLISHLM